MKKLFIILAWRNILKRRFYFLLETGGLALGLCCFMMVCIYVLQELDYDKKVNSSSTIYRAIFTNEEGRQYSGVPSALAYHIKKEVPQVEAVTRVFWPWSMFTQNELVQYKDKRFYEDKLLIADSTFFSMFHFTFLEGNPRTALREKNGIVINESIRKKYFGDAPAYGELLQIGPNQTLLVTAVVADNKNTHLDFNFLQPIQAYPDLEHTWAYTLSFTYLKVSDQQSLPAIQNQLFQLVMLHATEANAEYLKNFHYRLQPFSEIHSTVLDWDIVTPTSMQQLLSIGLIALFILLLAVVNFVNLSTARFTERMREMGVNAVLGADNRSLMVKMAIEYSMTIIFATLIGLLLTAAFLPNLSQIVNTTLAVGSMASLNFILVVLTLMLVILFVSCIFPLTRLGRFHSIDVLKSKVVSGKFEHQFRRALVVFQFTIAGALMAATLIINQQVRFLQNISLGFDKEQIAVIRLRSNVDQFDQLRNLLLRNPDIIQVAGASTAMGLGAGSDTFRPITLQHQGNGTFASTMSIDENFLELMNIPLKLGRNFDERIITDRGTSYILNETAVKQYQLSEPLGAGLVRRDDSDGRIIGVTNDFYFGSTSRTIPPLVMNLDSVSSHQYMFVKIKSHLSTATQYIETVWNETIPGQPMELGFQDEYFDRLYRKDKQAQQMATTFAAISIVIALLSLLGLSSFMVVKRTKEIGVRKVVGAGTHQILSMLCFDFLKLVLIATLISVPITWLAMDTWLQNYVNRMSLHPIYFILTGSSILVLSLIVIAFQSFRAAASNPVEALRSE